MIMKLMPDVIPSLVSYELCLPRIVLIEVKEVLDPYTARRRGRGDSTLSYVFLEAQDRQQSNADTVARLHTFSRQDPSVSTSAPFHPLIRQRHASSGRSSTQNYYFVLGNHVSMLYGLCTW